MATHKTEKYTCDNCGKTLPTCNNTLDIVTSKRESHLLGWSRLYVLIQHTHGSNNNGETDAADLCQKCAISLLADALQRVKYGERASTGVESSEQENWK